MERPALSLTGFTLVELLAALVIAGILAAVIFQFLSGQSRFAELQNAREEVQQNARTALDVISSELRGVGHQGIIAAGEESIRFRFPYVWGVACGYEPSASGSHLVVLYPPNVVPNFADGTVPDSLAADTPAGWRFFAGVTDATSGGAAQAAGRCNTELGLNPPLPASAAVQTSRARRYAGVPPGIVAGAPVYLYDPVAYRVSSGASFGGRWIQRGTGITSSSMQPFAGPLPAAGGLRFGFRDAEGAPTSNQDAVRSVDIRVVTVSRARFNSVPQHDTASTLIHLRNRN